MSTFNKPAFPVQFQGTTEPSFSGMTMRDYFAAKATGYDIEPYIDDWSETVDGFYYSPAANDFVPTKLPKKRSREEAKYLYADAMLKARDA
jgi:hypothetical protein